MSQLLSPHQAQVEPFLTVDFSSLKVTPAQFEALCRDNPDLRLELTARGELILMPPTGSKTGMRELTLGSRIEEWAKAEGSGVAFGSSAGFRLPNGAIRSPDASWVTRDRWESLTEEEQEGFAPLCPDFVLELRSPSDRLEELREKMTEYLDNGAQLGILIDPFERRVYVYRSARDVEILNDPDSVSGLPELPGLVISTNELWR